MIKHNSEAFMKTVDNNTTRFLATVGTIGVSLAAMRAPVVTGLYRNSLTYKLSSGKRGGFGSAAGMTGETATPHENITKPEQQNTVRVGSGVAYAGAVEKKHGTLAASFDEVSVRLDDIAKRVFD